MLPDGQRWNTCRMFRKEQHNQNWSCIDRISESWIPPGILKTAPYQYCYLEFCTGTQNVCSFQLWWNTCSMCFLVNLDNWTEHTAAKRKGRWRWREIPFKIAQFCELLSWKNLYKLCETLSETNSKWSGPSCELIKCYTLSSFYLCVCLSLWRNLRVYFI